MYLSRNESVNLNLTLSAQLGESERFTIVRAGEFVGFRSGGAFESRARLWLCIHKSACPCLCRGFSVHERQRSAVGPAVFHGSIGTLPLGARG